MLVVFVRVSIAVMRYHDHDNSYTGKHLVCAGSLTVQRLSPLSLWPGACSVQTDMVLATFWAEGSREWTVTLEGITSLGNLKACPHSDTLSLTRPHLLQQSQTPKRVTLWDCGNHLYANYHTNHMNSEKSAVLPSHSLSLSTCQWFVLDDVWLKKMERKICLGGFFSKLTLSGLMTGNKWKEA